MYHLPKDNTTQAKERAEFSFHPFWVYIFPLVLRPKDSDSRLLLWFHSKIDSKTENHDSVRLQEYLRQVNERQFL